MHIAVPGFFVELSQNGEKVFHVALVSVHQVTFADTVAVFLDVVHSAPEFLKTPNPLRKETVGCLEPLLPTISVSHSS